MMARRLLQIFISALTVSLTLQMRDKNVLPTLPTLEMDEMLLVRLGRELSAATSLLGVQADRGHHENAVWHSYRFDHGAVSRDALVVKEMRQVEDFTNQEFSVTQWITDPVHAQGVALGLAKTSLVVCPFSSIKLAQADCKETGTAGRVLSAVLVSAERNVYVVSALEIYSSQSTIVLQWYLLEGNHLEVLGSPWPLLRIPSQLVPFHVASDLKLLVLNHHNADVYDLSLNMSAVDLSLSQQIRVMRPNKAVINYVGDKLYLSVSQTESEVLIYQYKEKKFELISRVPSKGVRDICGFEIASASFLALSGEEPRVLQMPPSREWKSVYVMKIENSTTVFRWLAVPVPTYRDEAVLLADTDQGVFLLTWSAPAHFSVQPQQTFKCFQPHGVISQGLKCLGEHGLDGAAGLVVSKEPALLLPWGFSSSMDALSHEVDEKSSSLFIAIARLEHVPSPADIEKHKIMAKKNAIQVLQDSQLAIIEEAKRKLKNSLQKDAVVSAHWTVEQVSTPSIEISGQIEVDNIQDKSWSSEDWKYEDLATSLESQRNQLAGLSYKLEHAFISDHRGNMKIDSDIELQGSVLVNGKTYIESGEFMYLNDYPVIDLMENIVRLGHPKTIGGHKHLQSLSVDVLYVRDTINGHKTEPFASLSKPIEVHGDVTFTQPLTIKGDLKSIDTDNALARSATTNSSDIEYYFDSLNVESVEVTGELNGKPPSEVHTFRSRTEESEPLYLQVHDTLRVDGNLHATNINGINLESFLKHAIPLYTTQPIHIPGETFVRSCKMKNAEINFLNELSFPDEFVLRDGVAEISGYKSFSGTLKTKELFVAGFLDSVPVSHLVTLNSDQQLHGEWVMENLTVTNSLKTDYPIYTNFADSIKDGSSAMSEASHVVFTHLNVEEIKLENSDFLSDFVYQDEKYQKILAPKYFKNELKVDQLYLKGPVNGFNISEILTHDTKQYIAGDIKLSGASIDIGTLNVNGKLLTADLTALARDAIRLSSSQTSLAQLTFEQPILVSNGIHVKRLNGIEENQLITLDSDQDISAHIKFDSLKADHLIVKGNVNTSNLVNGENLLEVDNHRISRSRDQVIKGAWRVDQASVVGKFDVNAINEVPVENFRSHVLISSLPHDKFMNIEELHIKGHVTTKLINNYNFSEIANDAIWVNSDNIITGYLRTKAPFTADSISLSDTLNDVPISEFIHDIVTKEDHDVTFTGHKTMLHGAHFKEIEAYLVNGKKLGDALTKSTNQVIYKPMIFNEMVTILGNSEISFLNEVPLSSWRSVYSYEDSCHILHGNLTFEDTFEANHINVNGLVYGNNLEEFFAGVVWIHDDAIIPSKKTFISPVVMEKNLRISNYLNSVDLSEFIKDVVLIDNEYAEIKGHVSFHNDVFADDGLIVDGNLDLKTLHGCSPTDWENHAVYLDQFSTILGMKRFESVSSDGPINTKYLNEFETDKIVRLHEPQFIPQFLTFSSISCASDISVGGLVNDVRLDHEFGNTLMMEGDQNIISSKIFNGTIYARRDLTVDDTVNGYDLKDVVTLDQAQTIYGPKTFSDVKVPSIEVMGPVSGHDLGEWKELVVLTDTPGLPISGHWNIHGNMTVMGSVTGNSLLDGVSLSQLIDSQHGRKLDADQFKSLAEKEVGEFCRNLNDLMDKASKQGYFFQYLEGLQFLQTPHPVMSYTHIKLGSDDLLAVSLADVCEGILLNWDPVYHQLAPIADVKIGGVTSWVGLPGPGNQDVHLVSAGIMPLCRLSGGNLWLVKRGDPINFQHVQSLGNWSHVEKSTKDPNTLYTLDINGTLNEWKYKPNVGLVKIQKLGVVPGEFNHQTSLEHLINNKKTAKSSDKREENLTHPSKILPWSKLSPSFTVMTERQQTIIHGKHDDIKIFDDNVEDSRKLLHRLPATNPGHVQSIQFHTSNDVYIAFVEDKSWLRLLRYQGVSGFTEVASVEVPGAELLGVEQFPINDHLSPRTVLLLSTPWPSPGLYLLDMHMIGDPLVKISLPKICTFQHMPQV